MKLKQHIKETLYLAFPISVGQLGHIMMGVVDSLMVGKVGTESLAAAALVNGLFFLVLVIGIGLSMAATPFLSIAKGEKNFSNCGNIFAHSFIVNFIFSLILTFITFSISYLIPFLNQPKVVVKLAIPYLQVLSLSVIPFMLFQTSRQFFEGLSFPKLPMIIAIVANFFNAFFNWILIYGKFGFPALGLFGAGISTTLTRWLMALCLTYFVFNYNKVKIYEPKLFVKTYDILLIKKLIKIGLPSGFQYFLEVAAFSFSAVMIGWLGSIQLAAHQIALNLASVTYMIILGISSAGTIRVGEFLGEKNLNKVRIAGFTALGIAISIMFFFGVSFIFLKDILPKYYVHEIEVINVASSLLIVAALFQIFDGMQATGIGILRGLMDVKIPLLISILSYWLIGIPIGAILGFYFSLNALGIWIGLLLALMILGISMLLRFNFKTRS
ncbi:MAG: MATE family efflux transporter [Melioribacteraceae bacterium]|nr:MATE family efflux transporter [Melioribacteraceae bacterium]